MWVSRSELTTRRIEQIIGASFEGAECAKFESAASLATGGNAKVLCPFSLLIAPRLEEQKPKRRFAPTGITATSVLISAATSQPQAPR